MKISTFSRRRVLQGGLVSSLALAAPAIVGRAGVASAQGAFAGEGLITVAWSGNYERIFAEQVTEPFNERYGTKVETMGGWDQMVAQIKAAPEDQPPFDLTIADEFTTSVGMAEGVFMETDRSAIADFGAVLPWFDAARGAATPYGVPFGAGTLWMMAAKSSGIGARSWAGLWDERALGKVTLDEAAFYWDLCLPAILSGDMPGIDEVFGSPEAMEPLFAKLDALRIPKWYSTGAELANLMLQDTAQLAMIYSADAYGFMQDFGETHDIAVPDEGTAAYTSWFMKVRGTQHSDLSDLFMAYLLEQETQQRFADHSTEAMSRGDIKPPAHWPDYPIGNDAYQSRFNLFSLAGWDAFGANWDALADRMKTTITRTTAG